MKRILSVILSAVILLSLIPMSMFSVSAETDSQGVEYTLSADGKYYFVSGYIGESTEVVIPEKYNGLPVTSIGYSAFEYCSSLTSVVIPDSVTSIGSYAFSYCSRLTSIELGNSVTSISDYTFSDCYSLTSIEIPDSVTSIGYKAFSFCSRLTSVVIPDSVTNIAELAFFECTNLSYNEYDNAKYLGNSTNPYVVLIDAVSTDITNCNIHNNTKIIYHGAFSSCDSLTSIEIPDSVTSIGNRAFDYCDNLTSVVIPNSVTSLGDWAFRGCTNLSYNEYDNAKYLGNSTNPYVVLIDVVSTEITNCNIHDNTRIIYHEAFSACYSLTSVVIGDSVTSIGGYAFSDCYSLTSIEIPDSVTSIGHNAFFDCYSLTSIEIPDSVTSIGDRAFSFCDSLTDIYCEAKSQPDGWYKDWNYSCNATVHWGYTPPAIKITKQPASVSVANGQTAKVSLTATGDGLTYKWYYKNAGQSKFTRSALTGNTYSVTMDSSSNGRQVYCVVTDKHGNSVKSNTVTLSVRTFPDVPSTLWCYEAVEYVAEKGYITGYKQSGNFGPADKITRQDFVVILARFSGADLKKYSGRTSFPDVKAGSYYEAAVKWASANGIVNGYNNGEFGVDDAITREQLVTILYGYAKKIGRNVSVPASASAKLNNYTDAYKITGYAKNAVIWALHNGVISGMTSTTIAPQNTASRGQVATILTNICKKNIMG